LLEHGARRTEAQSCGTAGIGCGRASCYVFTSEELEVQLQFALQFFVRSAAPEERAKALAEYAE